MVREGGAGTASLFHVTDWEREDDRLDLPLGEEREDRAEPAPGGGEAEEPEEPPTAEPEADRSPSRLLLIFLGLLALGVLLGVAVVVGYLLPRPGPPMLRISPSLVDFEWLRVGERAPAREVTLESAGERPVEIGEIALAGPAPEDFAIVSDGCSGSSLAPGRTCTVAVRFSPREAAARRASLEVPWEGSGGPSSVLLVGEGVAPEPVVDRVRVDFAPLPLGERSEAEPLTVGNRGSAPFSVEGMVLEGPAAPELSLADDRCTGEAMGPGDECTVRVIFAPVEEGERRAVLRFRTGDPPVEEELPPVELVGVGLASDRAAGPSPDGAPVEEGAPAGPPGPEAPAALPPPEIVAEPASLDFGELPLGSEAGPEAVVFRNAGGSPVRVESAVLAGPDPGAFALAEDRCGGQELAAGERCTVRVAFRPRQEGLQRARLELRSPSLEEAPAVGLAGAGAAARLRVEPRELGFGEVRVSASAERRLTLSNAGRAPLEIRGTTVAGRAARELTVAEDGCPETVPLGPGERCELTVRFTPAKEGERSASLVIRHGGTGPAAEVPLRGTGLPAPAPRIVVSPGALRYPDQAVGTRSAIATVTVANRGSARLELGEGRIEGPDAADFRVVPGSCAGATYLVPGSECTVGLRFTPSAGGTRRARLVLPHNAQGDRAVVEVSGTGVP